MGPRVDGPVELLTARLRLRPFAADLSDVPALNAIQSDPVHMRFYPHPFSVEESRAWIERWLEHREVHGFSLFAIEDRETGEFLGNCGPIVQSIDDEEHVELGWSVTPCRARQGIASEAAAAWRDQCLGPIGLDHVVSLVRPENLPSRGVAERIGMTPWKETNFGSLGWRHIVFRVDAALEPAAPERS
jgi:ribosomal-protein-alanine N-acetyltransferase